MLRTPHATPPLFPYTPLFRSEPEPVAGQPQRRPRLPAAALTAPVGSQVPLARNAALRVKKTWDPTGAVRAAAGRDRKSTRLNSSHVRSSYAVFCVEKKTLDRH